MTVTRGFYAFSVAVALLGFHCDSDLLPPVSEISYKWIDLLTVQVSWTWERPENLPQGCEIRFIPDRISKGKPDGRNKSMRTKNRYYSDTYLTGETVAGQWEVKVQVVGSQSCYGWKSINKSTTVTTEKPEGKLVKDFKCVAEPGGMNCSWIPLHPSLNMSSRLCETTDKTIKTSKRCDQHYSDGLRDGCYVKGDVLDTCVVMETDSELTSFKPLLVIPLPKMSIREDGDRLNLTWTTPDVGKNCGWDYEVCFKECELDKTCQTFQIPKEPTEEASLQIAYDSFCRYDFEFKVKSTRYCKEIPSDGSGHMTYGSNRPPVQPLKSTIVIASILSVIFSVSLVLTCYCFKRHRAIFCPTIPDPSAIFKGMMVAGSNDLKTPPSIPLYIPAKEPVEPCKITLVTENKMLQDDYLQAPLINLSS